MLIVKTEVKKSAIHGTGLFAAELLQKDQIIWVMHKSFDGAFSKDEWDMLPLPAKEYLKMYMYWSTKLNKYVACLDNSRHMNHSESPNTKSIYFNSMNDVPKALRDSANMSSNQWEMVDVAEGFVITTEKIEQNQEISCNYHLDFPDLGGADTLGFLR